MLEDNVLVPSSKTKFEKYSMRGNMVLLMYRQTERRQTKHKRPCAETEKEKDKFRFQSALKEAGAARISTGFGFVQETRATDRCHNTTCTLTTATVADRSATDVHTQSD